MKVLLHWSKKIDQLTEWVGRWVAWLVLAAVVISASTHKGDAAAFLRFVQSPAIVALLQQFGFDTPPARR